MDDQLEHLGGEVLHGRHRTAKRRGRWPCGRPETAWTDALARLAADSAKEGRIDIERMDREQQLAYDLASAAPP